MEPEPKPKEIFSAPQIYWLINQKLHTFNKCGKPLLAFYQRSHILLRETSWAHKYVVYVNEDIPCQRDEHLIIVHLLSMFNQLGPCSLLFQNCFYLPSPRFNCVSGYRNVLRHCIDSQPLQIFGWISPTFGKNSSTLGKKMRAVFFSSRQDGTFSVWTSHKKEVHFQSVQDLKRFHNALTPPFNYR